MSFFKYYKEARDADGERLWWPGGPDGFPFRGPRAPTVTDAEYQNMRPTLKFRSRLFYLSEEADSREYKVIRDKCANGLFVLTDKDRVWDEETKNYRIYLEWVEPAHELPPIQSGVKDAIREYTTSESITLPYSRLSGLRNQDGW